MTRRLVERLLGVDARVIPAADRYPGLDDELRDWLATAPALAG
jgi:hypothetical protein